jgi:hypothetical protein
MHFHLLVIQYHIMHLFNDFWWCCTFWMSFTCIIFKARTATFKLGNPFLNCWKRRRRVPINFYELGMNLIWRWTFFYKEFYNRMILNFIHLKGYKHHSCFRQLYKTNYLIEWLAISCGCLWQMYQLREKILPIVLPYMVEAENFSDHPHIRHWTVPIQQYSGVSLHVNILLSAHFGCPGFTNHGIWWLILLTGILPSCQSMWWTRWQK